MQLCGSQGTEKYCMDIKRVFEHKSERSKLKELSFCPICKVKSRVLREFPVQQHVKVYITVEQLS